ncbi:MAG: hypothetical protein ABJG41_07995 [Cyclobacteriaceae bacterium]
MKKSLLISMIFVGLSALIAWESSAQLITDSDKRLKTQESKQKPSSGGGGAQPSRSPFAAFQKKRKVESRSINGLKTFFADKSRVAPRSISGARHEKSFFPQTGTAPRFSSGSPFRNQNYVRIVPRSATGERHEKSFFPQTGTIPRSASAERHEKSFFPQTGTAPRYSAGSPFRNQNYTRTSPRSATSNSHFDRSKFARYPRYSVGNIWTANDLIKHPRYSTGKPFDRRQFTRSPRYSAGNIWTPQDMSKSPRYSVPHVWSSQDLNKTPRYSTGVVWSDKELNKTPRYSIGIDWSTREYEKTPRYSVGNPYADYKFLNVPPQYSTNKNRFVVDKRYAKENRIYELNAGSYTGDFKANWKNSKDMHPSFNHHNANQSIEVVRESMRKWNVFWVRINSNQEDPKGVKEKVSKPKFDRKESEIWNN